MQHTANDMADSACMEGGERMGCAATNRSVQQMFEVEKKNEIEREREGEEDRERVCVWPPLRMRLRCDCVVFIGGRRPSPRPTRTSLFTVQPDTTGTATVGLPAGTALLLVGRGRVNPLSRHEGPPFGMR